MRNNDQYQIIQQIIAENDIILMEAAIVERLRRSENIYLHPSLVHAPLIYAKKGRMALSEIYNSYLDIAQKSDLPIFICTPTWRANYSRVFDSGIDTEINIKAARFLIELRDSKDNFADKIKIGELNDDEGPDTFSLKL